MLPKMPSLTYDDVALPPGRLADQLRAEQYRLFRGEAWLEELVGVSVAAAWCLSSVGVPSESRVKA